MKTSRVILAALLASGIAAMGVSAAGAQSGMGPGMVQGGMGPGMMQGGMGPGMMQGGMGPGMMQGGMNPQTMGRNMMRGDMGPGMMGQGMGPGMMGPGMMGPGMAGSAGGMRGLFGARVVPLMNLSVDDVRGYLDWRLERLGNERLKLGSVSADGGTITADIVTVDDSLVQRLKVDRRTGRIDYEN